MSWGGLLSGLLAGLRAASLSAAVMILAVVFLRALFQRRTPQRVFCFLWDAALVRLLILDSLPSPVSVWRWFPLLSSARMTDWSHAAAPGLTAPAGGAVVEEPAVLPGESASLPVLLLDRSAVLSAVWLAAALALAAWFLWSHLRSRRLYADSLPCRDAFVRDWLAAHSLRRRIQVRTSDRIGAPLTYGILHPVVLLPSGMDWKDREALSYILEHEYQHIRHFDTLRKALLAAVLCLHWFNPLVWVLYVLCSRDMELACDEAVAAQGADRAGYARTLLNMEERRSRRGFSGSHFSQNALEERIRSIMKHKHISIAALSAVLVVMGIVTTVFASASPEHREETKSGQNAPESGYVFDHYQAVENDVMILSKGGEENEKLYSVDGGKTWLSEERYHAEYGSWGDDWQVEWWTAEDYALWLEEEKQVLQSIIGARGYTGGDGWFTWDQKRVDETIAMYEGILEDIKNGALYSKTITDKNGSAVEDVALGSGTQNILTFDESFDEKNASSSNAVDEARLLEELKAFGVEGSAGRLTYNGKPIRCLVDGAPVGDTGYSVQYTYTNPDGVVDVHTLRSVIHNPDGSYDTMGKLTGVAAEGGKSFDRDLIEAAEVSDFQVANTSDDSFAQDQSSPEPAGSTASVGDDRPVQNQNVAESAGSTAFAGDAGAVQNQNIEVSAAGAQAAYAGGDGGGTSFEEIFSKYKSYGLVYTPREGGMGSLSWNGRTVKSFADLKPDGGAFSYQAPYAENGLRVYTEYDADGKLTGLSAE